MKNIDIKTFINKLPIIVDLTSDLERGIEYKLKRVAIVARAENNLLRSNK